MTHGRPGVGYGRFMARRFLPLAALGAAALLAAGCGGSKDETTSAQDWASGVCSAISTWADSLKSAASSVQGTPTKESLQSATGDVQDATKTLESDLKKLGKPDTEAGQQAQDEVSTLSDQLNSDVDKIDNAVNGVSGVSGLMSALSVVTGTLATMGNQLSTTFQNLQKLDVKGELESAFKQSSECKDLTSSNS